MAAVYMPEGTRVCTAGLNNKDLAYLAARGFAVDPGAVPAKAPTAAAPPAHAPLESPFTQAQADYLQTEMALPLLAHYRARGIGAPLPSQLRRQIRAGLCTLFRAARMPDDDAAVDVWQQGLSKAAIQALRKERAELEIERSARKAKPARAPSLTARHLPALSGERGVLARAAAAQAASDVMLAR